MLEFPSELFRPEYVRKTLLTAEPLNVAPPRKLESALGLELGRNGVRKPKNDQMFHGPVENDRCRPLFSQIRPGVAILACSCAIMGKSSIMIDFFKDVINYYLDECQCCSYKRRKYLRQGLGTMTPVRYGPTSPPLAPMSKFDSLSGRAVGVMTWRAGARQSGSSRRCD